MGSTYRICVCFTRRFKVTEADPPPDVKAAFNKYSEGGVNMTAEQFRRFLAEVQGEAGATIADAERIVEQILHKRHHIAKFTRHTLTLEDFHHFLFSVDFNPPIGSEVQHDMSAPLSHYFIYTGHNSYLTGNQLSSDCSDVPIIKALKRGVRVIELDVWPNSSRDNVNVLHGRLLMQSRGRGPGRRGRGRGFPPPPTDFPSLQGTYSNKGASSSKSAKDVLLTPETYFQNSITEETVLYIDPADLQWISDPWEIKKRYLATQHSPPHLDTYRYVYEQILTELAAVSFEHHYQDNNRTASPINYSKATIQSLMPIQAWGIHPHVTRSLDIRSKDVRYSYWDYITAFTQTFYYMNPPRTHSWFFRVHTDVLKNDLPSWFLIWWDTFGLQIDALPEHVRLAFNEWQAVFSLIPANKNISMIKSFIHFVIRFSIPWIWKWDFQCDTFHSVPRLKRIFFYKWWKQMDESTAKKDLLQRIKDHTQACLDACPKVVPVTPINPFIQIQQELRHKYPDITEAELVAKSMDFMKQQFLESMAPRDSSMKSVSSTQSLSEKTQPSDPYSDDDENVFTVLAGESQDPADDPPDPDFGDIWDSVTELITDKFARDKSKRKGKEK